LGLEWLQVSLKRYILDGRREKDGTLPELEKQKPAKM